MTDVGTLQTALRQIRELKPYDPTLASNSAYAAGWNKCLAEIQALLPALEPTPRPVPYAFQAEDSTDWAPMSELMPRIESGE
jgi:hypothetical protein